MHPSNKEAGEQQGKAIPPGRLTARVKNRTCCLGFSHPEYLVSFLRMLSTPNDYYRISSADRPPLRIGLLLDSLEEISAFFAKVVEDIKASNFARVELLILRKTPTEKPRPEKRTNSGAGRLLRRISDPKLRSHLLYDFYRRLDARVKPAIDPLAKVDCRSLFSGIETLEVEPIGKKFVQRFPEDALEEIRAKNLDV